ncbi:vacuolar sorting protein 18-like isoform X2 [Vicia villosa]|uniref:vacuolar sorting protein 18-like isoform X2 n=1 Tax=Vicia villosa TaxID=3911 RepID=UPI00273B8339|nr:vacuolar sorting protein 18-like isoform X2 [Vicia villosa]
MCKKKLYLELDQGRQVFTVDLLERHATKGRGVITCMAAGNDVIVLGTSKGWVIRHDFGVGDSFVSTKEFILGTDNGQLHELAVDEKDKKEKYIKFLYELTELPEALMGLQMETASVINETRYYVMAVTPTRLYFTGFGSLEVKSNAINLHIFVFHFPLSLGVFMPVNRGTIQA